MWLSERLAFCSATGFISPCFCVSFKPARSLLCVLTGFGGELQGERVTWEKLSAIQANCGVEMKLDQCMVRIGEKIMRKSAAERNGSSGGLRRNSLRQRSSMQMSRMPSWLNLSALGRAPGTQL